MCSGYSPYNMINFPPTLTSSFCIFTNSCHIFLTIVFFSFFFSVPLGLIPWPVHLAMSLELSIWDPRQLSEPTMMFILFTWGSLLHLLTFITGKILGYFSGHFNRTWSSFYILHFLPLFLAKDHSSHSLPWSSSRCGMHNYSPFDTLIFIPSNRWQLPIIFLLILL